MKTTISLFFILVSLSVHAAKEFGEKLTLTKSISIDEAIKNDLSGEHLIKGKVTKVCKMKGCWLAIQGKSEDYRVTFKDYGYVVPFSLIGKTILAQGIVKEKKLTLKQTKHYIEDEGGDPSKITEARTEYRVVASGIKVVEK